MVKTKTDGGTKLFEVRNLVTMALLAALLVIMAYTPLGYLKVGALSITFNVVPVAIGAAILGWKGGALLGGVFGLTSFLQCFGMDPFGATLLSFNPALTGVLCFVPRILMGLCAGLIFEAVSKHISKKEIAFSICGLACALLNTVLFMSSLVLLFGKTEYIQEIWQSIAPGKNVFAFVAAFVSINAVIEAVVATVLTTGVMSALYHAKLVKFNSSK